MGQLSAYTFAVIMSSIGLVAAKSCHTGGVYCGTSLQHRGDYSTKIITNLRAANEPTDAQHISNSLWDCVEHGDISYREFCSLGCHGGDDKDDYCNGSPEQAADEAGDAAEDAGEAAARAVPFMA
ncbi:Uu.00g018480.m01.CDS01 [Anthostomella pinea]|uniref:Uu.00g018480.m01.CDS01 n=1 Tax=Anthostomella pinea TaxID=933095 RepID=A0AAI8YQJ9_9PEZI|nr:Uu.00g018480.m01.CDS01 [Anthostomella pinea]